MLSGAHLSLLSAKDKESVEEGKVREDLMELWLLNVG
jgi:hypothetical protein